MHKNPFFPNSKLLRLNWHTNLTLKAALYALALGILPAVLAALEDDNETLQWLNVNDEGISTWAMSFTSLRNQMETGKSSGVTPASLTISYTLTPAPANMVLDDIYGRALKLAAWIKANKNVTEAMLIDLGLIGSATTVDWNALQPILEFNYVAGGQPYIFCPKGEADSVEFQVDRGDGKGWVPLGIKSTCKITDPAALPAIGVSALWSYQAIYIHNDIRVGKWSLSLKVPVHG